MTVMYQDYFKDVSEKTYDITLLNSNSSLDLNLKKKISNPSIYDEFYI